jgi:hypothetical protein
MSNINDLLTKRLKKADAPSSQMAEMARHSASGNLSGFSGIFGISELSPHEKSILEEILEANSLEKNDISKDLKSLISITSEVKAINNQAAILHGERIKKAQTLFKNYKEGAFTSWLIATYGNRQTPYNLMQYYEFYEALPKTLRPQIESMPRQAIYTLASRDAPFDQKQQVVENYKGETKSELLIIIRNLFPLSSGDKRSQPLGDTVMLDLKKILSLLKTKKSAFNKNQKANIAALLNELLAELPEVL